MTKHFFSNISAFFNRDSLRTYWQKKWFKALVFVLSGFCLFLLLDLLFPLPKPKPYSQVVYDTEGNLQCAFLSVDDKWRLPTHLDKVNPDMVKAILTKEDAWFYWHFGINPVALGRAFFQNMSRMKRVSGASTITMQLARLNEPKRRTYKAKFVELFRALQYELHYSKREILEMYLSYLPYGGNVEGVHAASYLFFNQSPRKLSLSQSVLLAIIPNRPNSLRLDKRADASKTYRNYWLDKFREEGLFGASLIEAAKAEAVPSTRYQIELKTPHLCHYFHQKNEETEIYSTIKPAFQRAAQQLLTNHVRRTKAYNVTNGAVLVVDNRTHNVVAYCGSADFGDKAAQGEVNGVLAYRSPGSALKPAVYALGFDRGIITPKMMLPDIPGNFSGFSPDNFDKEFRGLVTVHTALAYSLNLPPLWLLDEVGYPRFADLLEQGDFSDVKKRRKQLGYSLALGGCGVTLEEITRFYTNFANGGKLFPLNYTQNKQQKPSNTGGKVLFSPEAVYLIGNILSDLARPDLPQAYILDSKLPKIAWKTGTSYGKRDAWAIGYSPRYTVGVWMGNMKGDGAAELSGAVMAVPLLVEVFNAIDYDSDKKWFPKPQHITERVVCAETGMVPNENCTHKTTDFYIEKVSSQAPCNLYQDFYVSEDEQVQYCPLCLPLEGYKTKKYAKYEPELLLWLRNRHVSVALPPPHNKACSARLDGKGPKIISPIAERTYYIEKNNEVPLMLQAATDISVTQLHWYVNGDFFKTAQPDEKLYLSPQEGPLHLSCIDDKGRKSEMKVKVVRY